MQKRAEEAFYARNPAETARPTPNPSGVSPSRRAAQLKAEQDFLRRNG